MSLKILVAEDDPHTRAALAEVLRSDGHSVTEAADGHHAKYMFDHQTPDLACLDVMMPCLLYTSPSPRDLSTSRMPSSA